MTWVWWSSTAARTWVYAQFSDEQRKVVTHVHPRGEGFKECVLCAFANGFRHKPDTTFGTVNADVLMDEDPSFKPLNFVEIIRQSAWARDLDQRQGRRHSGLGFRLRRVTFETNEH